MGKIEKNTLFYGDNLDILRNYIEDESVDLIYLDPPFNSNRSYNVLFKDESGIDSEAQITAFDDSWHWGDTAEETYYELINKSSPEIANLISALRQLIGNNQMMAYLVMMTIRLQELRRVLKNNGSIYLHCDPTASHYLKILLDVIFGGENFRNEIIWRRTSAHSDSIQGNVIHMGRVHDVILFYSKSNEAQREEIFIPYSEDYINKFYRLIDENGRKYTLDNITGPGGASKGNPFYEFLGVSRYWRYSREKMQELFEQGRIKQTKPGNVPRYVRYLDEMPGVPLQDIWDDVLPIQSQSLERLGYPTQKPLSLLERIIMTSSNEGQIVLDPFSGCGTAIAAAQKLGRRWIGIDITYLAIALHKSRLKDMFGLEPKKDYDVIGEPLSIHDANQLAKDNRFQFEWWALSLIEARPAGEKKKGSDKGIDGIISFTDEAKGNVKQILVQVKSGKVNSGLIRDFRGTIERENNAVMGVFITLENSTKDMDIEALEAGYYVSPYTNQKYRKIQIFTIEDLLTRKTPDLPQVATYKTFKKAEKVKKDKKAEQGKLVI